MTYQGIVQNGVIQLEAGIHLPDGTEVQIEVAQADSKSASNAEELTVGQKLAALARWAETQECDLPADLAENHDHYLHGVPKRQ